MLDMGSCYDVLIGDIKLNYRFNKFYLVLSSYT